METPNAERDEQDLSPIYHPHDRNPNKREPSRPHILMIIMIVIYAIMTIVIIRI